MQDIQRLWRAAELSTQPTDVLGLYHVMFVEMMQPQSSPMRNGPPHPGPTPPDLILPSNQQWKEKEYFKLVEKQRQINMMRSEQPKQNFLLERRPSTEWDAVRKAACVQRVKAPRLSSAKSSVTNYSACSSEIFKIPPARDVSNAAKLLCKPPLEVDFIDENEMRNIYKLIYDVFRYKNILDRALNDVSFFEKFPELESCRQVVWLMLYELHVRGYTDRTQFEKQHCEDAWCLCPCNPSLSQVESSLWATRVKLAANISRARIKKGAVHLSDLLPKHLRDSRNQRVTPRPVTAWVNRRLYKTPTELAESLKTDLCLEAEIDNRFHNTDAPAPGRYRWCPACPMFVLFAAEDRAKVCGSRLVRDNRLILQERAFCYGAAALCKRLHELELDGSVLLTHITTPRVAAYLAQLLQQNEKAPALVCYGAGDRRRECEHLMSKLGIDNALIFGKRLSDCDITSDPIFENVVAILAAPPSSCSGVADPVELVCGRGGDLDTLELLTDAGSENEAEASKGRVNAVLEEQRKTLLACMSRPNVQIVLYETHSRLSAENQDMVKQALNEVNHEALYKHAESRGLFAKKPRYLQPTNSTTEINNNKLTPEDLKNEEGEVATLEGEDNHEEVPQIDLSKLPDVPETDLFEIATLPELCHQGDTCVQLKEEGVYLAMLQRKEIVNLNSNYMIKMAETRGLFGASMTSGSQGHTHRSGTKRTRKGSGKKHKVTGGDINVERIAQHTHSSLAKTHCCHSPQTCPKHAAECSMDPQAGPSGPSPARRWWAETARYLGRLRRSLVRQKLVSNRPNILNKLLPDGEDVSEQLRNIDEILRRNTVEPPKAPKNGSQIPPFPRLRLSRPPQKQERIPFPVFNCSVELPKNPYDR